MTKAEYIELIQMCANLETIEEGLERAIELTENTLVKNIVYREIEAIHSSIGGILALGNKTV